MDKILDGKFLKFQKHVAAVSPLTKNIEEDLLILSAELLRKAADLNNDFELYKKLSSVIYVAQVASDLGAFFAAMVKIMDIFNISLTDIMRRNIEQTKKNLKPDHRYKSYLLRK